MTAQAKAPIEVPDTPLTMICVTYEGDREKRPVYFITEPERTDWWHHIGGGLGSTPDMLRERVDSLQVVAQAPLLPYAPQGLAEVPKSPLMIIGVTYEGDRDKKPVYYVSGPEHEDFWYHVGTGLGTLDWLLEQRVDSLRVLASAPAPISLP